jgi:uncharacterized protein YejL (UPF0352 family)
MRTRESIYVPLFALIEQLRAPGATDGRPDGKPNESSVEAAPGNPTAARPFNLVSREVIEVQRVPPLLQPVLFMDEALEEYVDDGAGLYHRRWTVYFHVGCTSSQGTASATILNPLIDVLEAALAPGDGNLLGLGDIVTKAQLSGLSVKNLGNNSLIPDQRQAVAYLPFQLNFGPY